LIQTALIVIDHETAQPFVNHIRYSHDEDLHLRAYCVKLRHTTTGRAA
jgi:hypothetical protein